MSIKKSGVGIAVALTLVLSMVVGVASTSAMTTSELINLLIAAGVIAPDKVATVQALIGGTTPATSGYAFNTNLTIGSRGADVTALQEALVAGGHLVMPAGVAYGYFGSLTKSAVIQYQLAKGISPAAGYVGPLTRASLNASSPVVVVPTGSDLKVSLAATSPVSGVIVAGQAAANLAEFTFTNTSAIPAVVTNVTLARTGVSADTTLSNVYLYNGAVRLTDSATASAGKITFNAGSGIFTVAPGASVTVSVKADILSTVTGGTVGIALTGITANVTVTASYPISGSSQTIIATPSDLSTAASVLSAGTLAGGTLQAGSFSQTVWMTALNLSGRAVYLKSLALKVIGSIPLNSLQNVNLYVSGVQVASASGIDANGMITFDLSSAPYKMDSSRNLEVRADIVNGSSRTFTVSLQNDSDLQLIDSNYNIGITVTTAATQSSGTWTINGATGGSVTVSVDSTLSSGDVITGASNVALARYTFKAYGEDMKISYLQASSSHVGGLQNVALYANGMQIGSTQTISAAEATANTPKLFSLGSSLIIPAGQTVTVEIRGDVKNADGTNATTTSATTTDNQVVVVLAGYASNTQGSYAQQLTTNPAVAGVTGPTMTVKSATVSLSTNASFATAQTAVANTANVKLGSYTLQAGAAEAITVTNLTVTLGGAAGATTNVSNLYVAISGSNSTTPINPSASNNLSVNFTVPANTSKTIDVYGDLGALTSGDATTTLALSGYGVASNVTITKAAVTGQTITVGSGSLSTPTLKTGSGYTPDSQFVVGNTSQAIAYYNATSSNGTSVIKELYFSATGTSVANSDAPIVNVTVGGITAPVVAGAVTLTGLNISVPQGYAGVNFPVTVQYAPVGIGGVTSNLTVGLTLTGLKYTAGNTDTSTTTLAVTSNNNWMTLVSTKPTVTISNPSDTTVGAGGVIEVARITVSADSAGPIKVLTLPLSMVTTGSGYFATTTNFIKVGTSNVSTTEGFTMGATSTSATGTVTLTGGYDIAAGSSVTFSVYADATLTQGSNALDTMRTTLGSSSLFTWTDVNGNVSPTGAKIVNYPTTAAIVSY